MTNNFWQKAISTNHDSCVDPMAPRISQVAPASAHDFASDGAPFSFGGNARLQRLYASISGRQHRHLGYPNALDLDNAMLAPFLDLALNNVGDPFVGNNGLNTFELEKEVINEFADLLHAPLVDRWGYITNGGTEGNLYGLWAARERFADGVFYYSDASHYSIPKIINILGGKGVAIKTTPDGSIDLLHLAEVAKALRAYPAIWCANIGTTMKGAIDDLASGQNAFKEQGIEHLHIHCDAALSGAMLPFIESAPAFDFRFEIASIAISGHKFLGSPIPSGVVLSRPDLCKPARRVEYVSSDDSTVSGSRDGFATLLMWHTLKRHGRDGLARRVKECMQLTAKALQLLLSLDIPAWANPFATTIVLPRPSESLVRRWHLAAEGSIAHIIIMPGISMANIEGFASELVEDLRQGGPRRLYA